MIERKIVDYWIFSTRKDNKESDLIEYVNQYIKLGWQPIGSPFSTSYNDSGFARDLSQAMVKYED